MTDGTAPMPTSGSRMPSSANDGNVRPIAEKMFAKLSSFLLRMTMTARTSAMIVASSTDCTTSDVCW